MAEPSPPRDPYRDLFPLGAVFAVLGAAVWPLAAWAGLPYPGTLHASIMIEGFELSFVSGFLLTVAPRMTRTDLADQRERPWAIAALLGFGAAALAGVPIVAHGCALALLLVLAFAVARRFVRRTNDPPEEALFAPVGLALGIVGATIQLAVSAGVLVEPAPRFGLRLMSHGMVLAMVLGFGGLLVPVFLEMKNPLVILKIARPHERPARRALYAMLAAVLATSFVADAWGDPRPGAFARAAVGAIMFGLVWKLWQLPGRHSVPAYVLWSSGWLVGLGLIATAVATAAAPGLTFAAMHLTFLGGFGALTMGISSRVVATHGGHGPAGEDRILTPLRAALLASALALRLGAEADPGHRAAWLAASALAWLAAWTGWLWAASRLSAGRRPST